MKHSPKLIWLLFFAAVMIPVSNLTTRVAMCGQRPNVLLFFVDDMGWMDSSTYGSDFYETPSLDRLAAGGLKFTQAYAMPLCSPSRACLMTGRHAGARMQLHQAITGGSKANPVVPEKANPRQSMCWPESRSHLPKDEVTIADSFHAAGYRTHFLGKWHLGNGPRFEPMKRGFDSQLAVGGAGPGQSYFAPYAKLQGLGDSPKGEYICDRLTAETITLLDSDPERPFFIYLAHFNVHSPYQAPQHLIEKYQKKASRLPTDAAQRHPIMGAMIESMDTSLGRILDALDEKQLASETVIVFVSDNGGVHWANGKPGQVANDVPITSNAPLRGGKAAHTEGGVRVPMIVRWPDQVPTGKTDHLTHIMDIYPTLASACNVELAKEPELDGVNAWQQWSGKAEAPAREVLFEHFPRRKTLVGTVGASFVRQGRWKLVRLWGGGEGRTNVHELYDLSCDIAEENNVADVNAKRTLAMSQQLDDWLAKTNALLPIKNPDFRP